MSRNLLLSVHSTYRRNLALNNQLRLVSTTRIPNPGRNDQKSRKNDRSSSATSWTICGIAIGIISSVIGVNAYLKKRDDASIFPRVLAATMTTPAQRRKDFNIIADVVEVAAPAVVYIEINTIKKHDFFNHPLTVSNGSGFIVEEDGLILTNAHVVVRQPNTRINVKLADGRNFTGVVEDVDSMTDLATVRISCKNLPTIKLGESSVLRSGEWVVALGSPLALSNTVTAGIVSSTQRTSKELGILGKELKYIQTDAAITFGNSGGPLVNLDGEAIGINSMKIAEAAGISFAIPIDYAKEFLKRSKERISRGGLKQQTPHRRFLGITHITITPDILHELKHHRHPMANQLDGGVLVWKVIPGSPADIAGVSHGDIVIGINGKPVKSTADILEVCQSLTETGNIRLLIYRGALKLEVSIQPEYLE
ncbi:serine protease HTRA2, mitochondrial [Phlebotomus argentipes]|uniref:serine protease HTRA2, mitochondrial n=1 Tax=Phlebotomus argentipes TaxID=94469 RepID=UPI002892B77B|nr:serine protease HTRA2, mitochondrial [Phlebotomus argentipes]